MSRRLPKSGFTLTEMLVVIAIIGTLTAITVPAVMGARNLANKIACANNLKELGVAIKNYESNKNHLPPSFYDSGGARLNWIVALLPYLDQQNLADQITSTNGAAFATTNIKISKLICPTDTTGPFGLSYAANCGRPDNTANTPPNPWDIQGTGVFYDRSAAAGVKITIDLGDIYDGTTQTIMLAENSDAGGEDFNTSTPSQWNRTLEYQVGLCWFETTELSDNNIASNNYVGFGLRSSDIHHPLGDPRLRDNHKLDGIPYPGYDYARPAGFHSGVLNVLFCDGSVKSLATGLDYRIYCQMMTSDSRKLASPDPTISRGYGAISDSD